ncbi:MAG: DUF4623 domain-containing protein [Bacteroidales bacterium]|nr:DUF4623 domain-containing protein [Bacteroidales bacterium]
MKRKVLFSIPMLFALMAFLSVSTIGQEAWIAENIQDWDSQSYGNHTQVISVGTATATVTMTDCLVNPTGSASGTGSNGFVQMRATVPSVLLLPEVPGVSGFEFNIGSFGAGRSLQLQWYDGDEWVVLTTFEGIGVADANYTFEYFLDEPALFRLTNPSNPVKVYDIIVYEYSEPVQAAAPTFNPDGGTFFSPVDVMITTLTDDATIFYSLTSDEGPWEEYTMPVTVDETTTLYAYAAADDLDDSNVSSATFTFPEVTEVATLAALRDMPVDGTIYMYTGEAVIVAMDGFRNRKFIQDETAAILIDDQPGIITTEYDLYDVITNVAGKLNIFNNMVRFQPEANTAAATQNTPVAPQLFTLDEVTTDDQAKLIHFENVSFLNISDGQNFSNGTNYTITDGVEEFILRTDFWNVDFIGEPIPHTPLNISGVIVQSHDVLQIVPRFAADFEDFEEPLEPAEPIDLFTWIDKTGDNLPTQIGSGGNARAAALYMDRYVIVPSREGGPNIWVWDSHDPDLPPFALDYGVDVIAPLTFPINYVRTAGDAIYVSNLSLNPAGDGWAQGVFQIYRWDGLDAAPEVVVSFDALPGRLGDAFSIIGDPKADGHIIAHINTTKEFRVWNFENGVLLNEDDPDLITLDVGTHLNNHGIYNAIPGEDDLFIVTSNNRGMLLANLDGDVLAEWGTDIVEQRTYDPNIFYYDGKRYLTYTINNEGNPDMGARYQIVDISMGNTVQEAFAAITNSNEFNDRIVYDLHIGAGNASLTATNQAIVNEHGEVLILAHVVGRGFVLEGTTLPPEDDAIVITEFPWLESFEDEFPPEGWTNTTWEQSTFGSPNTGDEWAYSNLAGSELTTPEIVIPDEDVYALSFWYRAESATNPQNMDVLLSTDGENFDVVVAEIVGATNTVYQEVVYELEDLAGESIWVKFIGQSGTGGWSWGILLDDVGVTEYIPPVFFTVTFEVEDEDGLEITDAVITLNGVSNLEGDYIFEVEAGTYDYLVTALGYDDFEGTVEVVDEDVDVLVILIEETPSYCAGGPSSTADSNVEHVHIIGANDTEIDHEGCPGVVGVEDLTDLVVDLHQGQTYTLFVKFGTCGGNYGGAGSVWIDWGQNYTFDPEDLIHGSTGNPGTTWADPVEITFTVPLDAELGNTVMRVMQREGGSLPLDPCGSFSWGSVMDFGVNVLEELDTPPMPLDIIFNQPYHDGGNAAASAFDTDSEIDFEVADNFFDLEDEIEEFVFYGLAMKFVEGAWTELVPDDTEPFFVRFYEYAEGETTGLIAPVSGTYEIALIDDYGDGWNGGLVSVYVNGVAVLTDITLASGAGPEYHDFEAEAGDEISTTYIPGSWAFENYYAILDPDGNIIAEDGGTWDNPGATTPTGIEPGGDIAVLEPDWADPLYDFYLDAEVTHVGPIWNGNRQLYKFTVVFDEPIDLEEGWISAQIDADNGSGTWFLWLNSLAGDALAWQRTDPVRAAFSRDVVDMSGISEKGALFSSRAALTYDLAYELWGGELADPPLCASNPVPADLAENINISGNLSWTGDPLADGYKLYFGTLGGDWDLVAGDDLGLTTSYPFSDLEYSTVYEWKVVPYNAAGDAVDCPVWTFTTKEDPVLVPPLLVNFVGTPFPPTNWTRFAGILTDDTELVTGSAWFHHVFGNQTPGTNNSAYINMYGTKNHWLITPPINLGDGGYQVEFDIALTPWTGTAQVNLGPDDYVAFVISRDGGETWSDANVLIDWDENDEILPTGNHITLDVTDETGVVKFGIYAERPSGFSPDLRFYFTNFQVRTPPDEPIFLISDEEWDFGVVGLGEEAAKVFTITNDGPGILTVEAPVIDVTDEFILIFDDEDFPAELEGDDAVSFQVIFAPETGGEKTAQVSIGYNDGEAQTAFVDLMGEGFERPAGSTCGNPYIAELPLVDYMDNTEIYGNDYLGTWITPTTSYLNGHDFVVQFTLEEASLLSGSVAGSWTGLIIVAECPNPTTPPQRLAFAGSGSGGSFTDVPLDAGTYFAIVSTWPSPNFTDFTLNLSAAVAPDTFAVTFDVVDEDGVEITDAVITLDGVTNDPGEYVFDIAPGTYDYLVVALGYESVTGSVEVIDEDVTVIVEMTVAETVVIDEFPWLEDFEGAEFPPAGWNIVNAEGTVQWVRSSAQNHTPDGMYSAFHNYHTSVNQETWLITPAIEVPADDDYNLSFWSYNTFPTWYGQNTVMISAGSGNPADGDFVVVWAPESVTTPWEETVLPLSEYAGETIYVAFIYEGLDAHGWYLDDVMVATAPEVSLITFNVEDVDGNAIVDAVVTLNGVEYEPGEYVFELDPGTYTYSVSKLCYLTVTGEFVADGDMEINVVLETLPGDANADGVVDVLDVIAIANYYVDNDPEPFCFDNADVNGDGYVNVIDLIGVVNIYSSGKILVYAGLESDTAHIFATRNGILLDSDGTLAGLQFELSGSNMNAISLQLDLPGYELIYTYADGSIRAMIFSLDNTPIPTGKISLLSFEGDAGTYTLSEVIAGNLNAEEVPVIVHSDVETGLDTASELEFKAYPNPASDVLYVDINNLSGDLLKVTLINAAGQLVETQQIQVQGRTQLMFNVSVLNPGIYMLRLENQEGVLVERIMVK